MPTDSTVAPIKPTTVLFSPNMAPCTMVLRLNLSYILAMRIITMNGGSTSPAVAHKAPSKPPTSDPTYVDIFTAKAPGVLSDIAMKSTSSRVVIHS